MEDETTFKLVGGVILGVFSALGLPKLWESLFGHLTKKHAAKIEHDAEIILLQNKITRIVTSVDLLLIVIKHEFEEKESIINAIEKVEQHLHGEISEKQLKN